MRPLLRAAGLASLAATAGLLSLPAAYAVTTPGDPTAVYAPGSGVTLSAHVAGLDTPLTTVALAGLTKAQAAAAVRAAEAAAARRTLHLIAAPAHGKRTTVAVPATSVLAKAPASALDDPATLTTAYTSSVKLTMDPAKVKSLAARLTKAATVAPRDATARVAAHLILDKGYNGSTLDPTHLPATLVRAFGAASAVLPESPVAPTYGAATLGKVIVVYTGTNRLQLFVRGKLAQTFVVATGQAGYPSPHGTFHVIEREPAPTWTNPHDPWSESLPNVIGPGPDNPLGTRALQLDSPGILIHGIPLAENATLGQNASHGCVRMARAEVEKLYPQIPVGTPVLLLP